MAAISDPLYYAEIDLKVMRIVLDRDTDDSRPLGEQMTDDDYRAALREYFADTDVDDEFIEHALADVRQNEAEQRQIMAICDTIVGSMMGNLFGGIYG